MKYCAVSEREVKRREVKSKHEVLLDGSKLFLIPLVFENFGQQSHSAELFLNELVKKQLEVPNRSRVSDTLGTLFVFSSTEVQQSVDPEKMTA